MDLMIKLKLASMEQAFTLYNKVLKSHGAEPYNKSMLIIRDSMTWFAIAVLPDALTPELKEFVRDFEQQPERENIRERNSREPWII